MLDAYIACPPVLHQFGPSITALIQRYDSTPFVLDAFMSDRSLEPPTIFEHLLTPLHGRATSRHGHRQYQRRKMSSAVSGRTMTSLPGPMSIRYESLGRR